MNESNETTNSLDTRPLAQVIPFPKPIPGYTIREAHEQQKEYEERLARIRASINRINKLVQDCHNGE